MTAGLKRGSLFDQGVMGVATVGYSSHVNMDVMQAARAAGVTEVMPRSAFTQHLPGILSR